jgi:hypothetical protein
MIKLFIAGIIISSLSSCDFLKKKFTPVQTITAPVEVRAKPKADSLNKSVPVRKANDSVRRAIAEKKAFEKALTDSLMDIGQNDGNTPKPDQRYYIIVGSFSGRENADEAAMKFKSKGYKSEVIKAKEGTAGGQYLVSAKSFTNYDQASVFLKDFKTRIMAGAWIYTSN